MTLISCTAQNPPASAESSLSADFDQSPPFTYGMPEVLIARDTSPAWAQAGQRIVLTGVVYEADGQTPAGGIVLYYYHTDAEGRYTVKPAEARNMPPNKLGQTHGYLRGWVRTGADGRYAIHTQLPGSYPERNEPAHVHVNVLEPDSSTPYYLDDFVFDDDPLLTTARRSRLENRGGSGIIRFVVQEDTWVGTRDIILGLNVPPD